MGRVLFHTVIEEDLPDTAGGIVGRILKLSMGLTLHEISRAKFTEGGISIRKGGNPDSPFLRATVKDRAEPGDTVRIIFSDGQDGTVGIIPIKGKISILYEDEDVIVIDKPAGIVSHPSHGHYRDSLANYLAGYHEGLGIKCRYRIIGRLDKDTSGAIVFAKNAPAASRLFRQKEACEFLKTYLAVVSPPPENVPHWKWRELDMPIGPVPGELMKQRIAEPPEGRRALTVYRVLDSREGYAVIEVRIGTGRTHQIRVHLSAIGSPLLGDRLYGGKTDEGGGAGRALLHAWRVVFRQPFDGREIEVESPVPGDMAGYFGHSARWERDQ